MKRVVECVPNFSEGRDASVIKYITDAFRSGGIELLDHSSDPDHNRMVVTAAGEPEAVKAALLDAVGRAVKSINMTSHRGVHPRVGAVDVVPFIPIRNFTIKEAVALSEEFAREASDMYGLPVYLYERSARTPEREALERIRKGGFEGLAEKMKSPGWTPDYGPAIPHPTAGAMVTGARMPLIAFNVNLNTTDLSIARAIARRVRASNGGLPCLKAIGVDLPHKGQVQVSMNLTDHTKTSLHEAFEAVKSEAARHGVSVSESELIGLVPAKAMAEAAVFYLGLPKECASRVLETCID